MPPRDRSIYPRNAMALAVMVPENGFMERAAAPPALWHVVHAGAAITMFPPVTLDQRTAKQGLDILENALS